MKKLLITLPLIFLISCAQKVTIPPYIEPQKKEGELYTTEETNPYLGNKYYNIDTKELLSTPSIIKNVKIVEYGALEIMWQAVVDLNFNQDTKVVGISMIEVKINSKMPTKRDLREAGIIKGSDLILFAKFDQNTDRELLVLEDKIVVPKKGYVSYIAYLLRIKKEEV